MMHIAKCNGYYWCLDDINGATVSGDNFEEAFAAYYSSQFTLGLGEYGYPILTISDNAIYKANNDEPYATILCSFPNGTTYEQLTKLYPEYLI